MGVSSPCGGRAEIAVIGMAGRFPGARSVEEFWNNLRNGVESIVFFSDAELRASVARPDDLTDPDYVKARFLLGGALVQKRRLEEALVEFREVLRLDPQNERAGEWVRRLEGSRGR